MKNNREYHCDYCRCPVEEWESLNTFQSDRCCEVYSDFLGVLYGLEGEVVNKEVIIKESRFMIFEYPEMPSLEDTVNELIDISLDTGLIKEKDGKRLVIA